MFESKYIGLFCLRCPLELASLLIFSIMTWVFTQQAFMLQVSFLVLLATVAFFSIKPTLFIFIIFAFSFFQLIIFSFAPIFT
jgi:hypothetical protein